MPATRYERISEAALSYPGWRVVVSAAFGVMVGYSVLLPYTFSLFLKPLSSSFGWHRDDVSLAFGCAAITVAITAALAGFMLDRLGPRRVVIPSILVFGLAFASLCFLRSSLLQLYITFVVLGLVANGTTQLAYARTVTSWFTQRRGFALSLISAGAGLGSMVLPLAAAMLISRYGWRCAYLALGMGSIALSLPLALGFLHDSTQGNLPDSHSSEASPLTDFGLRPFWFLIFVIRLYAISFNAVISHFGAILTDRGVTPQLAATALSVVGIAGFSGRLIVGFILDRFSAVHISVFLFAMTILGLWLLSSRTVIASFISAALLGIAAGGESDITPYLLSRYYSLKRLSTMYGCAWTAFAAGTAIGPYLMGKLYETTGAYQVWGIRLAGIPTGIALVLMLFMPAYSEFSVHRQATDLFLANDPIRADP
jgi:MFS family permease